MAFFRVITHNTTETKKKAKRSDSMPKAASDTKTDSLTNGDGIRANATPPAPGGFTMKLGGLLQGTLLRSWKCSAACILGLALIAHCELV